MSNFECIENVKAEPVPGHSYKWQVVGIINGQTVVLTQHGCREDALRRARWERANQRERKRSS